MKACIVEENNRAFLSEIMSETMLDRTDFVVVAVEENSVCGSAAIRLDETFFQVEYFYVDPSFRNRGAASSMLGLIHRIAMECGVDATVFTYRKDEDTEELYDMLLVKHFEDFELYDHLWSMRLSELQIPKLQRKQGTTFLELGKALSSQKNSMKSDYYAINNKGMLKNSQAVLKDFDDYLQDISMFEIEKEKVIGAILFEELDDALLLSLLYTKENTDPVKLLELLSAAYQNIRKKYPEDTELYMNSLDHHADALIQKLTEQQAEEKGMIVTQVYTY